MTPWNVELEEPQVTFDMAGKEINFLIDTGATYSVLTCYSKPPSPRTYAVAGVDSKTKMRSFTEPLLCQIGNLIISHQFLIVPKCPNPLPGQDLLCTLGPCTQLGGINGTSKVPTAQGSKEECGTVFSQGSLIKIRCLISSYSPGNQE